MSATQTIKNPGIKFWHLMKEEGISPFQTLFDLCDTDILKNVPGGFYRGASTDNPEVHIFGFLYGLLSGDPFTQPNPEGTFGKVATWLAGRFQNQERAQELLAEALQYEKDVAAGEPDDSPWMQMEFWHELMLISREEYPDGMDMYSWEHTICEIRCSFQESLVRLLIVLFIYQFVAGKGDDQDKKEVQALANMFREGIQTLMDKGQELTLIDMIENVHDHLPNWNNHIRYPLETPKIIEMMHGMTRD
jgi:hypothetical protein